MYIYNEYEYIMNIRGLILYHVFLEIEKGSIYTSTVSNVRRVIFISAQFQM